MAVYVSLLTTAAAWISVIDVQATATSNTNHTGALLVSLLSCPFRDRTITSVWHQTANMPDLTTWRSLLNVTILRFRARGVGPNMGVLESLAGHLSDFCEANNKTSSTTITLSCLASAMGHMRFSALPMGRDDDHFGVNECYVPTDFLTLVSTALLESYSRSQFLNSQGGEEEIKPAVFDLLRSIKGVIEVLPKEIVRGVVWSLKDALAVWMRDDLGLVQQRVGAELVSICGVRTEKVWLITARPIVRFASSSTPRRNPSATYRLKSGYDG